MPYHYPLRESRNDTPQQQTHLVILVLKYHLSPSFGEMGDSQVKGKAYKRQCQAIRSSQKRKKKTKQGRGQKDIGANLKEIPVNKARIILATK